MTAPSPMPQRCRFLVAVVEQMGAPYVWGAKGKVVRPMLRAFDCSGLVTWAWRKVGGWDWCATHNTDKLWDDCRDVKAVRAGTLVLYGRRDGSRVDPSHVMVALGAGVVVGASGGTSTTLSVGDADAIGARVKAFPHYTYRSDVLGFRELPFLDEK